MVLKRGIGFFGAAILAALFLSACKAQDGGKSLQEHGMDIVATMEEMVKDSDYGSLMSNAEEVEKVREKLAQGDYGEPVAVYEVKVPDIGEMMAYASMDDVINGLSDSLKKQLNNRSASVLANMLNSRMGTSVLAASAIYTAEKTFGSSQLKDNTLYLYTFSDGCPIAVAFIAGEDRTVKATGYFIVTDGEGQGAVELLQEFLESMGITDVFQKLA